MVSNAQPASTAQTPPNAPTSVAIVDDHDLVRCAIEAIVQQFPDYVLHFAAEHGEDYIRKCKEHGPPAIALVDLQMEVMDGWVTIAWIREHQNGTLPLAITIDPNDEAVRKALVAGGCGVLPKSVRMSELKQALDDVRLSGFHRNTIVQKRLVQKPVVEAEPAKGSDAERLASLTKCERAILLLMLHPDGYDVPRIAKRVDRSPNTVETHRKNMYHKLGVHNAEQARHMARENGMGTQGP